MPGMAVVDVLDLPDQPTPTAAEEPGQRLEIFDYAVASTLEDASV